MPYGQTEGFSLCPGQRKIQIESLKEIELPEDRAHEIYKAETIGLLKSSTG